jgi:hypothetical protein
MQEGSGLSSKSAVEYGGLYAIGDKDMEPEETQLLRTI